METSKEYQDQQCIVKLLENIHIKLDSIENRLTNLENSGDKMSTHIDFIESIYEKVKFPFHYMMEKVGSVAKIHNKKTFTLENEQQ
jgi:hypothetical protein